jgi:drug/metabolite transporter (DMT)-like permease
MAGMRASLTGELLLLGVVTVWGTTFVLVKEALDVWPPFALLVARFGLGSLPFVPLLLRRGAVDRRTLARGAILGALLFLTFAFQTLGLGLTSPSRSAFFSAVSVPLVPAIRFLMTREAPARGTYVALLFACAGIVLLLGRGLDPHVRAGDLLTLGCALTYAFAIIALADFSRTSPVMALTAVQLVVTALLAAATTAVLRESPPAASDAYPAHILYLGIVATALTILAQTAGQRRTSVNRAAFLFALEPVMAAIFAWIARGEVLTEREMIGGALLVVAAIVADRPLGAKMHAREHERVTTSR